jgi:2-polyprenyl-3-methyl-5-hydroxy-6-metoxy-1,4-benzoquinol methylase
MAAAMEHMGRVMGDISGAMVSLLCAVGGRLRLFHQMAEAGPVTSAELAARAQLDERYVREWLHGLASAGYLEVNRSTEQFTLPPGLAMVVANDGSPCNLAPGYRLIPVMAQAVEPVAEAFRRGGGVPQDHYSAELYDAMEEMSGTWLELLLVQQWIPAVDGLVSRLEEGARVADIGCGHGRALILCAQAFPESEFVGYDKYGPNVEAAQAAAEAAGVADRVRFVCADATEALSGYFDVVTAFSVLHDAPDPAALLRAIRSAVEPDGVFLLLESNGTDQPLDNVGQTSTVLFASSLLYCLPTSLADGGPGLGTLGLSPQRVREYCGQAGFRSIRQVPNANPFNALYDIRP